MTLQMLNVFGFKLFNRGYVMTNQKKSELQEINYKITMLSDRRRALMREKEDIDATLSLFCEERSELLSSDSAAK
jgi:hypothetical protein